MNRKWKGPRCWKPMPAWFVTSVCQADWVSGVPRAKWEESWNVISTVGMGPTGIVSG